MAPPRTHQADSYLQKVGLDGFALLDEYFGKTVGSPSTQSNYHEYRNNNEFHWLNQPGRHPASPPFDHHHNEYGYGWFQDGYVSWGPRVWLRESAIDSNQAAQLYGGKVIVDHGIGNKIRKGYY